MATGAPFGRLLFPTIAPVAILTAYGLAQWARWKGCRWMQEAGLIAAIAFNACIPWRGTELEFVIMVIAVSCVKLLSAHNSTQHTSRKHKV
jgi:hypothetical protein